MRMNASLLSNVVLSPSLHEATELHHMTEAALCLAQYYAEYLYNAEDGGIRGGTVVLVQTKAFSWEIIFFE